MCHHFYEFSLKEKRKKIPKYKKEDSLLFHLFMFIHISEISPALTLGCEHKILSLCPLEKKRKTILIQNHVICSLAPMDAFQQLC